MNKTIIFGWTVNQFLIAQLDYQEKFPFAILPTANLAGLMFIQKEWRMQHTDDPAEKTSVWGVDAFIKAIEECTTNYKL